MIKLGMMLTRHRAWAVKFTPVFSRLSVKLQEDNNER
jgi:hypothetical protein